MDLSTGLTRENGPLNFPVSLNQERHLLAAECVKLSFRSLAPPTTPITFHLSGKLDFNALNATLGEIARRHDSLRSAFYRCGAEGTERDASLRIFATTGFFILGLYAQSVEDNLEGLLSIFVCDDVPETNRDEAYRRIVQAELEKPFRSGLPWKAILITFSENVHLITLAVHHLVSDAWSVNVLKREFKLLYCHFADGTRYPLSHERPAQFRDFILWQRDRINANYFSPAISYWRKQWELYGSIRLKYSDFVRTGGTPTRDWDTIALVLDEEVSKAIGEFARNMRVTRFVLFLTAFAIALSDLTGRRNFALWAHFANRMLPGFQDTIGWFANSHIIGIDLSDDPNKMDLLDRIRSTVTEAYKYQEVPGPLLWNSLGVQPRPPDARVLLDLFMEEEKVQSPTARSSIFAKTTVPSWGRPRWSTVGVYVNCGQQVNVRLVYWSQFHRENMQQLLNRVRDSLFSLVYH